MEGYFVGPAGWSYKDWEGIVYPLKKPAGFHPLPYLMHFMDIVEINSTFYRPPVLRNSISWLRKIKTSPRFFLSVKLHQLFTHKRKGFSKEDIDQFKLGIEPLRAEGRLASILIQFPWSFADSEKNRDYLESLFRAFPGYPLALEVRHGSWHTRSFFELLHEHGVAFCNIDQPLISNSIPPTSYATTQDFSYVRLHGRNTKNWFKEDAGRDERYNYLYSKEELTGWVERLKALKKKSKNVFVITNNHYRGQAVVNALQIKNRLTGEKFNIPASLKKYYPELEEIAINVTEADLALFPDKKGKKED
ncbi:MAG: DUF72 domain-containing protein [Acidobacteriota bacterium]